MIPNLIIIGAMKCGTTSLHHYLNLHPDINMAKSKEPEFFIQEKNWTRGLEWYESLFPQAAKVIGESTTSYSKYPIFKGVAARMYATIPDAKLIYIVRDPIERIISHYVERYCRGWENRSFDEAMSRLEDNSYVHCSKYYMQLQQYLNYYHRSKVLVIEFDDFKDNAVSVLREIFQFLGVDPSFMHGEFTIVHNPSAGKRRPNTLKQIIDYLPFIRRYQNRLPWLFGSKIQRPLVSKNLRSRLTDELRNDVDDLRNVTGREFARWSM